MWIDGVCCYEFHEGMWIGIVDKWKNNQFKFGDSSNFKLQLLSQSKVKMIFTFTNCSAFINISLLTF